MYVRPSFFSVSLTCENKGRRPRTRLRSKTMPMKMAENHSVTRMVRTSVPEWKTRLESRRGRATSH